VLRSAGRACVRRGRCLAVGNLTACSTALRAIPVLRRRDGRVGSSCNIVIRPQRSRRRRAHGRHPHFPPLTCWHSFMTRELAYRAATFRACTLVNAPRAEPSPVRRKHLPAALILDWSACPRQLEALLERECEMQVSRIFQEAERMQTRSPLPLALAPLRASPCRTHGETRRKTASIERLLYHVLCSDRALEPADRMPKFACALLRSGWQWEHDIAKGDTLSAWN
jgi:hypothetical protein